MMKRFRRLCSGILSGMLLCALVLGVHATEPQAKLWETTVLFTHDMHSHFLPVTDGDGNEKGGYARLTHLLEQQREQHPDALVLDAGDFSIGSLIQTLYTTQAAELRTMAAMGYDAVTAGNHEFDHMGTGFAAMLTSAVESGEAVPPLLMANYKPSPENPDYLEIQRAMAAYGVQETMLLERGGVTYGLFGLMGLDADDCAPASGFELEEPEKAARRCVETLQEQGAQFIICLSHSGTWEKEKESEDELLAKAVEGIDLIISGHTHTTLEQPIQVNNTYIVSCGQYSEMLGMVTLERISDGTNRLVEYELIPVNAGVPEQHEIAQTIENWKSQVGAEYLLRYDLTYDQVLTTADFDLRTPTSGVQEGNTLGELVSDAFIWAVRNLEKDAPDVPTIAVTADGVLRASLYSGPITTSQAFDVLSMGVGNDGTSGYPLVGVYLTGKELKAAMEVDASVTPIMPAAQLYMSGAAYSFNPHRMFFNRVTDSWLQEVSFTGEAEGLDEIEDDNLYRVVTGMYSAQMLGTVKSKSMGLLSLEPKMADGSPVTDFNACILYDEHGSEIKEWYALAAYLKSFGRDGIPEQYEQPDGRKNVDLSWNPVQLLKNANWITLVVLLLLALVIVVVLLVVRAVRRRRRRRRYGGRRRFFGR